MRITPEYKGSQCSALEHLFDPEQGHWGPQLDPKFVFLSFCTAAKFRIIFPRWWLRKLHNILKNIYCVMASPDTTKCEELLNGMFSSTDKFKCYSDWNVLWCWHSGVMSPHNPFVKFDYLVVPFCQLHRLICLVVLELYLIPGHTSTCII